MALLPSLIGRVKEMSVRPVAAEAFWTMTSMLISASAMTSKILAALPIWSGTPTMVIFASPRSEATPVIMACSISLPFFMSVWPVTQVPGLSSNELRTCTGMFSRRAYSTQRRCSTFEPQAAISIISS